MKILITGTTQGIGLQLYNQLCEKHDVHTINRREFKSDKNYIFDLENINDIEEVCSIIKRQNWDILINNAGGASPILFENTDPLELIKCTTLNYIAPVLLMQAVLPGMKERHYGRVINISSIAAKGPREYIPHYAAAKSALESFAKSMAVYYSNCGITINCICPGGVNTETSRKNRGRISNLLNENVDFYSNCFQQKNGLGGLIEPQEVVNLIEFFISSKASAISGQSLNICGTMETH